MLMQRPLIYGSLFGLLVISSFVVRARMAKPIDSPSPISIHILTAPLARDAETLPVPATPSPTPLPTPLPVAINLDVPFTIQAPNQVWDDVHEETCEEAAALIAQWFIQGKQGQKTDVYTNLIPPDIAEKQLQAMITWENATFGSYQDTTLRQTQQLLSDNLGIKQTELLINPSTNDLRQALAAGNLVLVPTAGKRLKNPNFKNGGPPYHMLVLRGYDAKGDFITNDPGTRKGEGYRYSAEIIMSAIHDWAGNKETIEQGQKVVLVVEKK